jgi:DNA/RNA endonuclease YhcR with UshA esterase domain
MSELRPRYAKRLPLFIFLLVPLVCWAQSTHINDGQAGGYVGQRVVVEGTVAAVFVSQSGNTFLNFGAAYPDQDFSAVIFADNASSFGNVEQLEGKRVAISGVVRIYRGKPEIILRSADQLRTLE